MLHINLKTKALCDAEISSSHRRPNGGESFSANSLHTRVYPVYRFQ